MWDEVSVGRAGALSTSAHLISHIAMHWAHVALDAALRNAEAAWWLESDGILGHPASHQNHSARGSWTPSHR